MVNIVLTVCLLFWQIFGSFSISGALNQIEQMLLRSSDINIRYCKNHISKFTAKKILLINGQFTFFPIFFNLKTKNQSFFRIQIEIFCKGCRSFSQHVSRIFPIFVFLKLHNFTKNRFSFFHFFLSITFRHN